MLELFAKLRKLPADARGAIDALGAAVFVRVISLVERAVQYRQGLLEGGEHSLVGSASEFTMKAALVGEQQ